MALPPVRPRGMPRSASEQGFGSSFAPATRMPSTAVMARSLAVRDSLRDSRLAAEKQHQQSLAEERQRKAAQWRHKMDKSPYSVNLVAEGERIEEEQRVRGKMMLRKLRKEEREREALRKKLVQQAFDEVVLERKAHQQRLDQARLQKEQIQEERRKARAARESAASQWGVDGAAQQQYLPAVGSPSSSPCPKLTPSPHLSLGSPLSPLGEDGL